MRIRLLTSIGGSCDGQPLIAGTVVEIGENSAREFVARDMAELVDDPVRTAAVEPPRNAAARTGKARPGGKA